MTAIDAVPKAAGHADDSDEPETQCNQPNRRKQLSPSWLANVWERIGERAKVIKDRSRRAFWFAIVGLVAAVGTRLLVDAAFRPQDLVGWKPLLGVAAGAGTALVLWALESVFRHAQRLRDSELGQWMASAALLGATTSYGLTASPKPWATVGLLSVALLTIALVLAKTNKAPLPIFGLILFLVAAAVSLGSYATSRSPAFEEAEIAVIVGGGVVIAIGFMVQEFSGSQGWYVVLVIGGGGATAALVAGLNHADGSPLHHWSFLAALLFAFVVSVGLLSWRVLTWGWFWFISAVGCSGLLLVSNASDNARHIGFFILAAALVAGASTSLSKVNFRLATAIIVAALGALTIYSGIQTGSGGDARTAAVERERLEGAQTRVVGLHNCLARLLSDPGPTNVPSDGPEDIPAVTATRCSEAATAGTWERLLLPAGSTALATNARSRLTEIADSIVTIAGETTERVTSDDEATNEEEDEPDADALAIFLDAELAPRQPSEDGDVTGLVEGEPVSIQIQSDLSTRSSLAASIAFRQLELDLIAIEIEFLGGSRQAPRAIQRQAEATAAIEALQELLTAESNRTRSLRTLLIDGANDAAAKLFPGGDDDIELGPYGWLALLFVALMAYRRAEIANNRRTSSPITIELPVSPASTGNETPPGLAHLRATMEAELSRAGVEEPAALPGSVLTDELVELVQGDTFQGSKLVAAVIKTLKSIGFPVGGITVRPILSSVADGRSKVTVWVHTSRTKKPLYTESFVSDTEVDAVRQAAFFVARAALNYNRNVPRWGRWHSEDGVGFRLFNEALHMPVVDKDRDIPAKRKRLEAALAASPPTAQIRVELGHIEDLAHNHVRSLRLHLQARVEHRRLLIASYRVATSASMLSGDLFNQWFHPDNQSHRAAVVDLLADYDIVKRASEGVAWRRARLGDADSALHQLRTANATDYGQTANILLCVAWSELTRIRYALTVPAIVAYAGFQSERRYWMRFLRDVRLRRQTTERYETARLIIELRMALLRLGNDGGPNVADRERVFALIRRLDAIVARPQIGSLALYNAACFWSLLSESVHLLGDPGTGTTAPDGDARLRSAEAVIDRATTFVRKSRRSGRGPYPSQAWMTIDPDLKPLRQHKQFKELIGSLTDGEVLLAKERKVAKPAGTQSPDNPASPESKVST